MFARFLTTFLGLEQPTVMAMALKLAAGKEKREAVRVRQCNAQS